MKDSQNKKDDLIEDHDAIARVLTIVYNSTFRGAGAKSVAGVIEFLENTKDQVMDKINDLSENQNGSSEE